ncbi:MAG TPA: antibiotic biosynthesis monooxygenase [Microscillaceae bacterium]|nr:antibiotic biosynthesis monooxygenase [Microscillaceae bacterium]
MIKVGLLVRIEAKPGKETAVENFIQGALPLAQEEPDTITWYAFKINASTFGIFDTFPHEEGRSAHLTSKIAEALMANAPELLAKPPVIEQIDVLASKLPQTKYVEN